SNRVIYIQRTIGESREWQYYLEDRRLNSNTAILQPYEDIEIPGNLQDLSISYKEGTSLDICVGTCPLGDRVEAAIHSNIDPTIRGGFCPAEVYLDIGYHDLFEDAENEDGLYIARPFLSVRFWGYDTPNDWEAFRKTVLPIAELQIIRNELERITGRLE